MKRYLRDEERDETMSLTVPQKVYTMESKGENDVDCRHLSIEIIISFLQLDIMEELTEMSGWDFGKPYIYIM